MSERTGADRVATVLEGIVGPEFVTRAALPRAFGPGPDGPEAEEVPVVLPASTEEVAEVLRAASRDGLVAGVGGGGFTGYPPSPAPDFLLRTTRLGQVEIYEPADLTGTFGAALTGQNLADLTHPNGQWLPLDPVGWRNASLGGMIATGQGGMVESLYGRPRDLVLGLTLVTGDGRMLDVGGRVVKNVAGFDLVRLAVGSRGALGVITRVSVRLFPLPELDEVVRIRADSVGELASVVQEVRRSHLPLAGSVLRWSGGPEASTAVGPEVLIRIQGNAEPVEAQRRSLLAAFPGYVGEVLDGVALDAALQGEPGPGMEGGRAVTLEARVLPGDLMGAVELVNGGLGAGVFWEAQACIPTGRIRVSFHPQQDDHALAITVGTLRGEFERKGGSLLVAAGPSTLLKRVHPMGFAGASARLMRGIRSEFDPHGALLPGPFQLETP